MASALDFNDKISQNSSEIYAASATGNDTYVVTLAPIPAALAVGMIINFNPDTANTGAATLNVNALGAKPIVKNHDQVLVNNDIEAGQIVTVVYDGTSFQMQSQLGNAGASPISGNLVQVATVQSSTAVSTSTTIPMDDTIPQITEGAEALTVSITPTSATNKLIIQFNGFFGASGDIITAALFQDATADALASGGGYAQGLTPEEIPLTYVMTAGTTSSTTFRIRFGPNSAATTYFLGIHTGALYGASRSGSIVVYEVQV